MKIVILFVLENTMLSAKQKQILELVQQNPQITLAELAKAVGLKSVSTVHVHIRKGALLNKDTPLQKETIPSISHAFVVETEKIRKNSLIEVINEEITFTENDILFFFALFAALDDIFLPKILQI